MVRREILYGRSERLRELLEKDAAAAGSKPAAGTVPAGSTAKPPRGKRRGGHAALAPLATRLGVR